MNYEAMYNNELLSHFAETRDEAAFRVFHDRHNADLRGFLFHICHVPPQDIADHLQCVWSRVVDKIRLYDPKQSATAWVNTLAKNIARNLWQQSISLSRGGTETCQYNLSDKRIDEGDLITDRRTDQTVSDPSTPMIQEEQRQQIHEAIEKLPPLQKEAITMVVFDEIPYDEAAELLGIPSIVFAQRLSRGKKSLYQLLRTRKDEFVKN
jgi:RNA polymerase sigma-70 factor (ECF subfamily)